MPESYSKIINHVQGCLLGMGAGDWLEDITLEYGPTNVTGTYQSSLKNRFSESVWNIPFAWQPSDSIELALALANSLIKEKAFKREAVYYTYLAWMLSRPFKEDRPIFTGIGENTSLLLRTAVLACFGRNRDATQVVDWCALNVKMTHPDPVSIFANEVYAVAVLSALKAVPIKELYENAVEWGFKSKNREKHVLEAIVNASTCQANDASPKILSSLQNAFYQLLHAKTITEGIINSMESPVFTNSAICGALLGAAYGKEAFPEKWKEMLLASPLREKRPSEYLPCNISMIAEEFAFSVN